MRYKINRFKITECINSYNRRNKTVLNINKLSLKLKVNPSIISRYNTGYRTLNAIEVLYNMAVDLDCCIEDFYVTTKKGDFNVLLAVDVKTIAKKSGLFYKDFAKKHNVNKYTLYRWAKGEGIIKTIVPFFNICEELEVTANELIEV